MQQVVSIKRKPMTLQFLSLREVQKRLKVSRATVWRYRKAGRFPVPVHDGYSPVWRAVDVERWIKARQ
jgi:predicted DNA-binding transcriptional regulator AlpA